MLITRFVGRTFWPGCHGTGIAGGGGRAASSERNGGRGAQCGGSSAGRCRSADASSYDCT